MILFQADWAPNKGVKEHLGDFKDKWDKQNGVTYIPWGDCGKLNLDMIKEGGVFDEETIPPNAGQSKFHHYIFSFSK